MAKGRRSAVKSDLTDRVGTAKPALTVEARENRMIALAMDAAEKQLREGTASSQVIVHYLKLGSTRDRIEKEILEKQKALISAKTESLQSAKRIEELYSNALEAMRNYSSSAVAGSRAQVSGTEEEADE